MSAQAQPQKLQQKKEIKKASAVSTEASNASQCDQNYATLIQPGVTVKLEDKTNSYTYKMVMVCPGSIVICKSIDRVITETCEVGGMMSLVRPTEEGSCMIPVKIVAIGERADLIAIEPMGKPQTIQRRVFARVKADSNVHIKLQIDNHSSRYKSLNVYDISGGGVGVTVYSKNPLEVGLYCKIEIQLPITGSNNRLNVRGQLAHCSPQRLGGMEYLLGIKFIEVGDAEQRKIIEYVAQRQKELDLAEEAGRQFAEAAAAAEEEEKKRKDDANKIVA